MSGGSAAGGVISRGAAAGGVIRGRRRRGRGDVRCRRHAGPGHLRPAPAGLDPRGTARGPCPTHLDHAAIDLDLDARRLRALLRRHREARPDDAHLDAPGHDDEGTPRSMGHVAGDAPAREHQLYGGGRPIADLDAGARVELQGRAVDQGHRQGVGRGLEAGPLPGRGPELRMGTDAAHDEGRARERADRRAGPGPAQGSARLAEPRRHATPQSLDPDVGGVQLNVARQTIVVVIAQAIPPPPSNAASPSTSTAPCAPQSPGARARRRDGG